MNYAKKLISEYKKWEEKEPCFNQLTLSNFGDAKFRISSEEIIIIKRGRTTMDKDVSMYIPLEAAEDLCKFLNQLFQKVDDEE